MALDKVCLRKVRYVKMRHPPAKSGFTFRRGAAQADSFVYSPYDIRAQKKTEQVCPVFSISTRTCPRSLHFTPNFKQKTERFFSRSVSFYFTISTPLGASTFVSTLPSACKVCSTVRLPFATGYLILRCFKPLKFG